MSANTLPDGQWDAYMAGIYVGEVKRYMADAKHTDNFKLRCIFVQGARRANRRLIDHLRRARSAK